MKMGTIFTMCRMMADFVRCKQCRQSSDKPDSSEDDLERVLNEQNMNPSRWSLYGDL